MTSSHRSGLRTAGSPDTLRIAYHACVSRCTGRSTEAREFVVEGHQRESCTGSRWKRIETDAQPHAQDLSPMKSNVLGRSCVGLHRSALPRILAIKLGELAGKTRRLRADFRVLRSAKTTPLLQNYPLPKQPPSPKVARSPKLSPTLPHLSTRKGRSHPECNHKAM